MSVEPIFHFVRDSKKIALIHLCAFMSVASVCFATEADGNYYNFTIPWDEKFEALLDVSVRTHKGAAGSHGRVVRSGDELSFEDGTSVRFWGVGVTFSKSNSNDFPPSKNDAKQFAKNLAKYGINHVLFAGFDNSLPEVFRVWEKTGTLDSPAMDRFDYLVSQLAKNGIYYSLALNNSSLYLFQDSDKSNWNNYSQHWKRYNHVRLFYPEFVEKQAVWVSSFCSHLNPYTGKTYAKDPANVYFSAVIEDSIFFAYFNDFKHLTRTNVSFLERLFNQYLLQKYKATDSLKQAWHILSPFESLENGTVQILRARALSQNSSQRKADTIEFLIGIDVNYAERIKRVLESAGYGGLFNGTNAWYGYGSLLANASVGDYIEMHGYFDHPIHNRFTGKYSISGKSYLVSPSDSYLSRDNFYPLYRTFISGLVGKPVIISEWNHATWSKYAYEGPLLLTAYGSFQGYSVLDAHTWFSYPDSDLRATVPTNAFAVGSNPIFLALSPSLSIAFLNRYISTPSASLELSHAVNYSRYYDLILKNGLGIQYGEQGYPLHLGFLHKLRNRIVGEGASAKSSSPSSFLKTDKDVYATSNGEIYWNFAESASPYFYVDAEYFKAVMGQRVRRSIDLRDFSVAINDHGAVTLVPLDDKPIVKSKRLLLTVVSSLSISDKNVTEFQWRTKDTDIQLKMVKGVVRLVTENLAIPKVEGIFPGGSRKDMKIVPAEYQEGKWMYEIQLGQLATPWILIRFE